ncbi:probable calcium-binding protein CML13 [Chenopodium quinoa]|uniref:probable calcium-binding protein CML13 n=1 Tax=Chenopodium quinoa TaxID=63459 RepID=UPI000B78F22F|nr:probable calcium-binding protein CML13 [Chenopodium quinoa]
MGKEYEDQIASMREAFSLFDTDGDGKIAPSDLGIVMRSLGSNPTQSQLRHILEREKLTSPFDFHRFLELMVKYMKPDDPFESELRDAFRVLDKDCSGFVSVSDLRHILTNIGEKLDPAEFDDWIQEVDVGEDGRFQYEEFISQLLVK